MRRLDRLVALLLGLALAGAAVLTGIETMVLVLGKPALVVPRRAWASALTGLRWDDSTLQIVAGALAGVGALLVLAQIVPRRRVRLLLRTGAIGGTWLLRKGLNRKIAYDIGLLSEVDKAVARVGRRRVRVKATLAPGVDASTGRTLVSSSADATLGQWPLLEPLRVKVKVSVTDLPASPTTDLPVDARPPLRRPSADTSAAGAR